MVTSNVLQRTFRISWNNAAGTAFTVDHDGRRYFVTARHVVDGITSGDHLQVFNDGQWRDCPASVIGFGPGSVDVAVLALPVKLSPNHPLPATAKGLSVGQEVYLAGFPFGLHSVVGDDLNANYPIAFVKRGVLSAFGREDGHEVFYLDAHNNPGFSGGPVVFRPTNSQDFSIAGVISGYRFNAEPVYDGERDTGMRIHSNTGIVICWPSHHVMKLIEASPNGLVL